MIMRNKKAFVNFKIIMLNLFKNMKKKLLIIFFITLHLLLFFNFLIFNRTSLVFSQEILSPTPIYQDYKESDYYDYKENFDFNFMFQFLKLLFFDTNVKREDKDLENNQRQTFQESDLSIPQTSIIYSPTPYFQRSTLSGEKSFSSLREIFNDVGNQIGVPPIILEAVLQIEMPSVFRFTPEQIKQYSLPGNTIPNCHPNVCSATGPMQMTTGRDANNNPLCPNCCWKGSCLDTKGGCPNAWAAYGWGDPCNLKDNITAAARKLKKDSKSNSPIFWTKDEVYRASYRYYGNCTVAYPRLGNRTYCEYVWWYYQSVN